MCVRGDRKRIRSLRFKLLPDPFSNKDMELIYREQAIEKLEEIRDKRKGSCSRQAMLEAAAMQYAIEVVRRIPEASRDEDTD